MKSSPEKEALVVDDRRKAICWGCHMQCGVLAHLDQGKIIKLRGDPDYYTKGSFCDRGARFVEHLYHPDRLNYPMKRVGERGQGKWQKVSWDQALDEIAEKLKKIKEVYGAEALATTGGTARGSQETFKERFMYIFGSPNRGSTG